MCKLIIWGEISFIVFEQQGSKAKSGNIGKSDNVEDGGGGGGEEEKDGKENGEIGGDEDAGADEGENCLFPPMIRW